MEKYIGACEERNLSPVKVAFAFLVHHSKLDSSKGDAIIIGGSSMDHMIKNLEYCRSEERLDDKLLEVLEECWKITMPVCPTYYR